MSATSAALQLWHAEVGEQSFQAEQAIIPLLSASETRHLAAMKSIDKRREFLLSRALMHHALAQYFNKAHSSWDFIYLANSAPNISNLPAGYHVSLTHRKGKILFVISPFPVGVDIELIKPKNNLVELSEMFMTSKEKAKLSKLTECQQLNYYYQVWTAKECYYKALLPSEQASIQFTYLNIFDVIDYSENWQLIQYRKYGFLYSLVTKLSKTEELALKNNWFEESCLIK